jgi:hypothetical protein
MKRLLAYLFLVVGFGFVFSFNAHSKSESFCIPIEPEEQNANSIYIWEECYIYHKKVDLDTFVEFALTHYLNSVGVEIESRLFKEETLKWLKKYLLENKVDKSKIATSIDRNLLKIAKKKELEVLKKVSSQKSTSLNEIVCILPSASYNKFSRIVTVNTEWARSCGKDYIISKKEDPFAYNKLKNLYESKNTYNYFKNSSYININIDELKSLLPSYNFDNPNLVFAKKDITIDSEKIEDAKKKVEVAKVEEPKQEEFKPVNKDVDNEAPIIDIADSVTVNNQTFTLKGKVTDKSKLYIEANNRPLTVAKNGEFKLEGFVVDPEAGEQIKLVAIDQWQNKSEKIIKINVEFKDVAELRSYADPNPNKIKVKEDKNKIAIIIGIEKYRFLKNIDAPYANRDANAFRAYANRALGIPNKNIKILIDENATRGETLKALTLWLPQAAKGKNKDIYIFFAGHGLASDDGKNLYILPQDGDAALLQYTSISRLEMFELINKVEPNSVTMFFDTCYSGQTRDEEMLVAGLRPIRLTAEEQDTPNNFTIFTASNYDQTSGSINQAKHGIFSYYLMKGMEGQADSNQDKKITNGELIAYLKQNVSEEAFINNRQQEPMLSGDPDKVLISYN